MFYFPISYRKLGVFLFYLGLFNWGFKEPAWTPGALDATVRDAPVDLIHGIWGTSSPTTPIGVELRQCAVKQGRREFGPLSLISTNGTSGTAYEMHDDSRS